jgi:dihydrofolate reductase
LRADLRRFKALTMGHHLIVGRKTWESIGRPLAGRKIVIVSRNPDYVPQNCPECLVSSSLQAALELARSSGDDEAFIGGGGDIFVLALPLADRIYLTEVDTASACDVFFPRLYTGDWRELERQVDEAGDGNEFRSTYRVLERVNKPTTDDAEYTNRTG